MRPIWSVADTKADLSPTCGNPDHLWYKITLFNDFCPGIGVVSLIGLSHIKYVLTALFTLLLIACAGPTIRSPDFSDLELAEEKSRQRVEYVRLLIQEQERIAQVAYRLSVGTVALCRGEETLVTGAYMFDWDLTSDEWIDVANEALGINLHTPGIEVLFVLPGSPADTAGIRPGDRIIRLDEWRVPSKRGAFMEFYKKLRSLSSENASSINLRIQREARFVDVTLYPIVGCDFPIVLREDESMGAFSDGEKVMINRGMLRFTRNDDELAMVITHEMAHNVLDHIDTKRKNAVQGAAVGVVVDILLAAATGVRTDTFQQVGANIGALAYSKDFEREADYYSAYLMAQAGFDVSEIPTFWRYLGSVDQKLLEYNFTHPTSVERSVNMRKTVDEIERKQRAGLSLQPDL